MSPENDPLATAFLFSPTGLKRKPVAELAGRRYMINQQILGL